MRVKSYYAESVEAAVIQARQELGPDAMLLNSRKTLPEARHLGQYEVVFALAAANTPDPEISRPVSAQPPGETVDKLAQDVADLRRQLERTLSMVNRAATVASGPVASNADALRLFSSLAACEVDAELAHNLIGSVRRDGDFSAADALEGAVAAEIQRLFTVDERLGIPDSTPSVVALVGPPGAGKTTTIAKLAVRCGVARQRRVQLLSMDTDRVGGTDLLRTYASIIGVGFDTAEDTPALTRALQQYTHRDLILIDTPGFDGKQQDLAQAVAEALTSDPRIDTHLVLPASMKMPDLRRTAATFEIFQPKKLLFTRLDETGTFGALLNLNVWLQRPISYMCAGQAVPEDLECARPESLASLVLRGSRRTEMSAAA